MRQTLTGPPGGSFRRVCRAEGLASYDLGPFSPGSLRLPPRRAFRRQAREERRHARSSCATSRIPLVDLLRNHPTSLLLAMGARFAENACFYLFTVFIYVYASERRGFARETVLIGVLLASGVQLFSIPAFAALSDRLGRRPVYLAGALFLGLIAFPFFWLVDSGVTALIWLALLLGLTAVAAMYGPQAAFFSELFGTNVRYSGASLVSQLAAPFAGGPGPLIATALLGWSGGHAHPHTQVFASLRGFDQCRNGLHGARPFYTPQHPVARKNGLRGAFRRLSPPPRDTPSPGKMGCAAPCRHLSPPPSSTPLNAFRNAVKTGPVSEWGRPPTDLNAFRKPVKTAAYSCTRETTHSANCQSRPFF